MATGAFSAAGVADATGKPVLSVPAPPAERAGSGQIAFNVLLPGGRAQSVASGATVTVSNTATGEVTTLTMTSDRTEATAAWTGRPYTRAS